MPGRLEQYLEEVSRPLPAAQREEWRAEAAEHLTEIIAAYEELGQSREQATELAIARFGDAKQLGRRMRAEAHGGPLPTSVKAVAAAFFLQAFMCWWITIPRFVTKGLVNEALLIWGAPALFIAFGLMSRRPFWRKAALGSVCTTFAFSVPFLLMCATWAIEAPLYLGVFRFLAYSVVPLWQFWVLTRPEVRALFDKAPRRPALSRG